MARVEQVVGDRHAWRARDGRAVAGAAADAGVEQALARGGVAVAGELGRRLGRGQAVHELDLRLVGPRAQRLGPDVGLEGEERRLLAHLALGLAPLGLAEELVVHAAGRAQFAREALRAFADARAEAALLLVLHALELALQVGARELGLLVVAYLLEQAVAPRAAALLGRGEARDARPECAMLELAAPQPVALLGAPLLEQPALPDALRVEAVGHGVGLARKALADPSGSSTPPLPESSWTPPYQSTPPNSASDARTAAGRLPASRKRTLAEGGQALLRYAAMSGDSVLDRESEDGVHGRAKLGDIEQQLAALLDQIKKSSIEGCEEPTRDSKPSSKAGEETMKRMLKTLESIKRELVSRNGKRRRTLTDHSDDAGSECSQSSVHFGRGRLVRGNSGINLLNMDQDSVSQSMNAISSNNAPHKTFGAISALDFDLNGGLFCDIEDFDMASGNGRQQIIVGCHLTHEGLYFTLAPSDSGFNEEELANAMTSLRIPAASSIARATIEAADRDKNGCVSMEEFLSFLKKREEELEDMFKRIDTDNDGIISIQDLKIARESGMLEQNATDDELQALLEWMDTLENAYEDGQIHFEEFRTGMILLPPSTTINDLLRHFREKGTPRARYSRNSSVNMSNSDLQF
mmetsp:Transcript_3483/g.10691  ORF Transcript_3483/g.10691 Transcript_3483/m.10691 type:complete len:638 (+) Transcript_3483:675-2588(+)